MICSTIRRLLLPLLLGFALTPALLPRPAAAQVPTGFTDELLQAQMDWPVDLAFLPDGRLLVAQLKTATVRMIVDGSLAGVDPIGTIDSVEASGEEQGLLSVAVDPRWPVKPYVYVYFTGKDSTNRIERFKAIGDLADGSSGNLSLDPASARYLIRDIPSIVPTHNGGSLRFGPDSMLYVSLAEDARTCAALDTTQLLGVIARLDVRNVPDGPGPPDKALLVPATGNPYPSAPTLNQRLMYVRGLRNPFRMSIDMPTGRLFIGDVGWNTYEEVDVAAGPGLNFGWPFYEGTQTYVITSGECGPVTAPALQAPMYEYNRTQYCTGCLAAIIGGVVLRHVDNSNVSFPAAYDGQYLFSDYYTGFIWMLRDSSGTWVKTAPVPGQPNSSDWADGYTQVGGYVLGPDGAVYYALNAKDFNSNTGEVRRIVHYNGSIAVDAARLSDAPSLAPAEPSPTRGGTDLRFVLPHAAHASLALYDALGRRVRTLVPLGALAAGAHSVHWDGRDADGAVAAPGVYLVRLVVDGRALTRRIAVIR